jgi:hypothetical protein
MTQGLATFPGIRAIRSAVYTHTPGILPGSAELELVPQLEYPQMTGDLELTFGGASVVFHEMKGDSASFERSAGGLLVRFHLLDRRWKWRECGGISGAYNTRLDDASIVPGREKKPQELATLLLKAMGESGFDVSSLPNDTRPEVDWVRANPAQELAHLCESLGCIVWLCLDDCVRIFPKGQGAPLVADETSQVISAVLDPPEAPDEIVVTCAPTRYQDDFPLIAVGQESDGSWKPLDELSYAPDASRDDGGFATAGFPFFQGVTDPEANRELAESMIYRCYQIDKRRMVSDGIAGFDGELDDFEQITLETQMCETLSEDDPANDQAVKRNRPMAIFGRWYRSTQDDYQNTSDVFKPITDYESEYARQVLYADEFQFDLQSGVVTFSSPVFRWELDASDNTYRRQPADLVLRTACTIRARDTGAQVRYERSMSKPSSIGEALGTQPKYLRHDEITRQTVPQYDDSYAVSGVRDNQNDIHPEIDYYLSAAYAQYQTSEPQSMQYAGLKPLDVDGATASVTYGVGLGGATTRAARNTDFSRYTISFQERKFLEQLGAASKPTGPQKRVR